MQETAARADKHFRTVVEPIKLEECQCFRVQQCVASIKAVMIAVFTRELDASQQDLEFVFHRSHGVLHCSGDIVKERVCKYLTVVL